MKNPNFKEVTKLINVSGVVELKMDPAIRKMSRELTRLLSDIRPLEEEAATVCKEMTSHMDGLQICFERLGGVTSSIQKTYKKVAKKFNFDDFSQISELYTALNKTFLNWSDLFKDSTSNFFKNIRMMFTFSNYEVQGMEKVSSWIRLEFRFNMNLFVIDFDC